MSTAGNAGSWNGYSTAPDPRVYVPTPNTVPQPRVPYDPRTRPTGEDRARSAINDFDRVVPQYRQGGSSGR